MAVFFDSDQKSKRKLLNFRKNKISTIKRQQFYTHHRKSLRKLAYIHTIEQTEPIYA
jgi:uncharacterized membrane protein YgaE (UPF0421/DUF939 family)